jgi:hypothetical protein
MAILVSWLVSLLLFISVPIKKVDPSLALHYKEFMDVVQSDCPSLQLPNQLTIETGNLTDDNIGVCVVFSFRKHITIDNFYWNTSNEQTKRQLLFHELTHCVLNINHIESDSHYMNPYIIEIPNEELYKQLKETVKGVCNE